jgi:hypothetical protein
VVRLNDAVQNSQDEDHQSIIGLITKLSGLLIEIKRDCSKIRVCQAVHRNSSSVSRVIAIVAFRARCLNVSSNRKVIV